MDYYNSTKDTINFLYPLIDTLGKRPLKISKSLNHPV